LAIWHKLNRFMREIIFIILLLLFLLYYYYIYYFSKATCAMCELDFCVFQSIDLSNASSYVASEQFMRPIAEMSGGSSWRWSRKRKTLTKSFTPWRNHGKITACASVLSWHLSRKVDMDLKRPEVHLIQHTIQLHSKSYVAYCSFSLSFLLIFSLLKLLKARLTWHWWFVKISSLRLQSYPHLSFSNYHANIERTQRFLIDCARRILFLPIFSFFPYPPWQALHFDVDYQRRA